jgi:hypothetical protein
MQLKWNMDTAKNHVMGLVKSNNDDNHAERRKAASSPDTM